MRTCIFPMRTSARDNNAANGAQCIHDERSLLLPFSDISSYLLYFGAIAKIRAIDGMP